MTCNEVMAELEAYGNANTKKVFLNHGALEPFFGVKVGDLKKIQKKVKKDHALAAELWATGNSDAMYLAALIEDEKQVTANQLRTWLKTAYWYMLSEYSIGWLAADSGHAWELGREWINAPDEQSQTAGWASLASMLAITPDENLDLPALQALLERVGQTIHESANRTRYTMNGFVIAAGSFSEALKPTAEKVASAIGKVHVDVGGTACKVPLATEYIAKTANKGRTGKRKKMARC